MFSVNSAALTEGLTLFDDHFLSLLLTAFKKEDSGFDEVGFYTSEFH